MTAQRDVVTLATEAKAGEEDQDGKAAVDYKNASPVVQVISAADR